MKVKNKLIIILFLYFVVITMLFFGNILISTLFIILAFTSAKKLKRTAIFLSIFFIITISIPAENYAYILKATATLFPTNSENYKKMIGMAIFVETGEETRDKVGMAKGRAARFPELLRTFLSNPFFGSAPNNSSTYEQAGAHLYWMNRLTVFGILGFAMTVLFP